MLITIRYYGIEIPMYGLMIVIGCILGVLIAIRFNKREDIVQQDILFSCCYAGIGAFVGAKLLYLIITLPQLINMTNPPELSWGLISYLFSYGFVFYGGALGGLLGVFIYARQYQIAFFNLAETLILPIPLVHSIGRIGCFCAGCCYGRPMNPPWGVFFKENSVAPQGIALFPIQLFESALNMILFIVLFIFSRKKRSDGQVMGLYFTGYGIERFFLEYFRYDTERGIIAGLSTSQWISLIIIPIGIFLLLRSKIKKRN
ncbi:MAG: prolipoprotein diacylglyceryl transferase family protein [Mariniphaga sp.]